MARYRYKARNPRGELLTGEIDANTPAAVGSYLWSNRLTPVDIAEAPPPSSLQALVHGRFGRPSRKDIVLFSRQLYSLLHAGVPLLAALDSLRETYGAASRLGLIVTDVRAELDAGRSLSTALARHPETFSPLYLNLVQTGETAGKLDTTLLQLSRYLERDQETSDRIRRALRYPSFVLTAIFGAVLVLNYLVIPQFARVFRSVGATLPLPTRVLMGVNDFTVRYWWVVLLGLAGTALSVVLWLRSPGGRRAWDRWRLRFPILGPLMLKGAMARFARTLQLTQGAGVPIAQAITLVAESTDNRFLAERLQDMRRALEWGESLARSARAVQLFPPLVLQMIAVGEQSGNVEGLMGEVADYYEREVAYDIDSLAARIEPLLLGVLGALVLVLALGIYLPIWDLVHVMR
jgi:MSHA biogenesis protein MshG